MRKLWIWLGWIEPHLSEYEKAMLLAQRTQIELLRLVACDATNHSRSRDRGEQHAHYTANNFYRTLGKECPEAYQLMGK